jgi:predicted nucleotidyltransferase
MVELSTIKRRLEELAKAVLAGSVARGDAAVCAQVYNVLLRAVTVELKLKEQLELEARLEELATALERQQQKGGGGYSFTG